MRKRKVALLCVEILEARPNKMFSDEQRSFVRFLRFNEPVACAECGKKKQTMWTMRCEFHAFRFDFEAPAPVVLNARTQKTHRPLEPVCGDHPISAAWREERVTQELRRRRSPDDGGVAERQ